MVEAEEVRKTRPAFYAALAGALLVGGVVWWVSRPRVPDFAEVIGVVTLDGRPLDQIEIRFLPDSAGGTLGPMSSCFTGPDGRYTLRCDEFAHDGAVPGTHRVVVLDITTLPGPSRAGGLPGSVSPLVVTPESGNKGKVSRFHDKYAHSATTPFVGVKVKPGTQELNFDLAPRK